MRLHQAAGVAAHVLALICSGGGAERQRKRSRSGQDMPRTKQYRVTFGDIMFEAVNKSQAYSLSRRSA